MPKFFINKDQINNGFIEIIGKDVKHINKVLRYKIGDIITVCDKEGIDYTNKIIEISEERIFTKIIDMNSVYSEPNVKITIYQGLPKADKMEHIIEKCTELGVSRIVPVAMKNSVVKYDDYRKEQKKIERWNKIAEAAAKQCGRGVVPKVENILSFEEAIKDSEENSFRILLYEKEKKLTIREIFDINSRYKSVCAFIGPEGGFQENEILSAKEKNIHIVTLGKRILRTETVSTVIVSILMYCMEEI